MTKGLRYVLAGFVNMGAVVGGVSGSHLTGVGAGAGTGAPLPDLSTLNFNLTYYNPKHDGHAAANGFVSGDIIVGLEKCEFVDAEDVDGTAAATGVGEKVLKRFMESVDETVTDEEWRSLTHSCESLLPAGQSVAMVVSRSDVHL